MDRAATGFSSLDALLGGGFSPGEFVIVAGTSSCGKTSFVSNIAVKYAQLAGKLAVYFTLQNPAHVLRRRMLIALLKLNLLPDNNRSLDDREITEWVRADQSFSGLGLIVHDDSSTSPAAIHKFCRQLLVRQGLGLLIVDGQMGLNPGSHGHDSREHTLAAGLSRVARALDLPLVLTLAIDTPQPLETRLVPADIPEAWRVAADTILLLHSNPADHPWHEDLIHHSVVADIVVVRQPFGPHGEVRLLRYPHFFLFEDPKGRRAP